MSALADLKAGLETKAWQKSKARNERDDTDYEIYIKAAPQAIWDAITTPEWTAKYGYGGLVEYDLRPGGAFKARAMRRNESFGLPEVASTAKSSRAIRRESWCRPIASCSATQ